MNTQEYRLMYLFGAWVTGAKIYAETDAEAIFDATERANELAAKWPNGVALWCGNRLVKRYK